ncbi:ORF59-like protein [Bufonid herpesvirus 1]|uniref:ORF59-like protein n=1 Tax=Bufonid herpesvirus 1 TaxID=2282206 RepID=UPI000EB77FEB|nr:ORF59-like protein [Bufonid herpesvirus 1]AXF48580.1 ORF59-like protein [Bufonid herpesvirus 1]
MIPKEESGFNFKSFLKEQCYDSWLTEQFMLFIHRKTNPQLVKPTNEIIASLMPNKEPVICTASLLERVPALTFVNNVRVDVFNAGTFRLVVLRQFCFFLIRYALTPFVQNCTPQTIFDLEDRIFAAGSIKPDSPIKLKYRASLDYRFHNQLFQIAKQFDTPENAKQVAVDILLVQYLLARQQTNSPLAFIPAAAPWTQTLYNTLVEFVNSDAWTVSQERIKRIKTVLGELNAVSNKEQTSRFLCLVYYTLNAHINWFRQNTNRFLVSRKRGAPTDDIFDVYCSACFKCITSRSTLCKQKHVESMYCLDDNSFTSSCCEAHLVAVDGSPFVVYLNNSIEKFGPCQNCSLYTTTANNESHKCVSCASFP